MNVVKTIVPGNSEAMSQVSRQDRDSASKRGGSGFSDTLGSLDKGNSPKQSSTSAQTDTSGDNQAAAAAQDDTATPVDQKQNVVSKPVVPDIIFLDAVSTPVAEPVDPTAITIAADGLKDAKVPDVNPNGIEQLFAAEDENTTLPALSDLAKLVTALSKVTTSAASSETDDAAESSDDKIDVDATSADPANENMDLLSLLASTEMPVAQPVAQNVPQTQQFPNSALGAVTGAALGDDTLAAGGAADTTVVRLQKQDVPAIDLHIDTNEDGSKKIDVSTATGDVADVVQVMESRRFIGLAATSNATAITSAMAADPDWAATMAGQTSNSPMISSTGQVVHVLKIQMTPVDLGHVTAAMKLVGDELSVQLTAHTLKGYSELQKDSSGILDALKSQGFNVDQVTVTLASSTDRQDSGTNNRQPTDLGQQGAQQGQRGQEEKPQEQFYRPRGTSAREETVSHESTSQPEVPARASSLRPDHVYL